MSKTRGNSTMVRLIDRSTERELLRKAIDRRRSTVLTGGLGIGKTRLLQWAEEETIRRDAHVEVVRGNAALRAMPLAALHHLVPAGATHDGPAETVHRILQGLRAAGAGRPLVLVVDDLPRLDDRSAAVIGQCVASGIATMLGAARLGETLPPGCAELVADGLIDLVHIEPLDVDDTTRLAAAVAGRQLADDTSTWIWQTTRGNPLFTVELVRDALERLGAQHVDQLAGTRPAPTAMEAINRRLSRLPATARAQLELVAIAGVTSLSVLEDHGDLRSVELLEAGGLIVVARSERRLEARVAHPLVAGALLATMTLARRRQLALAVSTTIERHGARRQGDALLIALARADAGAPIPSAVALEAARTAHVRGAPAVAERFARIAYEQEPTVAASVQLAGALMYVMRPEDADALLDEAYSLVAAPAERALVAGTQALNALHGLCDIDHAARIVSTHLPSLEPPWAYMLDMAHIGIDLYGGRIDGAVVRLDATLADPALEPPARLGALTAGIVALTRAGRCDDAISHAHAQLSAIDELDGSMPIVRVQLALELAEALAWHGDIDGADGLIADLHHATDLTDTASLSIISIVSALVTSLRGHHRGPAHVVGDLGALEGSPYRPWLPHVWTRLASVALRDDDVDAGLRYLDEAAAASRPGLGIHVHGRRRAEAEVARLAGDIDRAVAILRAGWGHAVDVGDRTEALLAAVRVQALDAGADLRECRGLSASMQGSLARGVSHCLDAAAALDADAASSYLLAIRHAGHVLIAEDLFSALAGRAIPVAGWPNEPLRPVRARPEVHARLTQREREVATLITSGRSDGDIAKELELSVRTVHAHVRSIFLKLDITRRADVDV